MNVYIEPPEYRNVGIGFLRGHTRPGTLEPSRLIEMVLLGPCTPATDFPIGFFSRLISKMIGLVMASVE